MDPNNPADARAVGRDTDIVIRQIAATPTPAPSTSQPPAPTQPATPTTVAPSPSTAALVATAGGAAVTARKRRA